ncbi:MAG TPA: hypothetical protein VGQ76_10570 [Thermoanaerobaculia bacterium]|nr:hypothetical protein [Thermoanaerobaculia bacterium]
MGSFELLQNDPVICIRRFDQSGNFRDNGFRSIASRTLRIRRESERTSCEQRDRNREALNPGKAAR